MLDRWPVGNWSRVDHAKWEHWRNWVNEGTFPRASQAKTHGAYFVLKIVSSLCTLKGFMYIESNIVC